MNTLKSLFAASLVLASGAAYAGQWSSGGGELFRDADNPWFLQNTTRVTYCVMVDEANFGSDQVRTEQLVTLALSYWKKEFAAATPSLEHPEIAIATQDFVQTACDDATDLRFQLGVLTDDQRAELTRLGKRPQQFVGIAVRTEYDEQNLKGRGFIYISPEAGPARFEGDRLRQHPWSGTDVAPEFRDGLLHKILVHELGHVFGLEHVKSPDSWDTEVSVMDEEYPETLVALDSNVDTHGWGSVDWIPGFFAPTRGKIGELYKPNAAAVKFFDSPFPGPYYSEAFEFKPRGDDIEVVAYVPLQQPRYVPIGVIKSSSMNSRARYFPAVKVKLNPHQRVFQNVSGHASILGPGYMIVQTKARYTSYQSGLERQVFYSLNPVVQSFSIGGVMDGDVIPDLDWKE